jgi:hypothetical protein
LHIVPEESSEITVICWRPWAGRVHLHVVTAVMPPSA